MANILALAMKFTANTSGIDRGAKRVANDLKKIKNNTDSASKSLKLLVGIEIGKAFAAGFSFVSRSVLSATNRISTYVDSVRESTKELQYLAQQANTNSQTLQKMAAATAIVGIDQEKLSDILKDVNDRVGDFLQTGAGPMADFFEKIAPRIGVTANQFKGLSGPQALQLYVSSLQKANLNQQEFTFYLEAMASDATRLIPLLRDGGREMNALGERAERLGIILSTDQVDAVNEMNRALNLVSKTFEGIIGQVTSRLAPAITDIAKEFLGFVEGFRIQGGVGGAGIAKAIVSVSLAGIETFLRIIESVGNALISFGEVAYGIAAWLSTLTEGLFGPTFGSGMSDRLGPRQGRGRGNAIELEGFADTLRDTLRNSAAVVRQAAARIRESLDQPAQRQQRIPQRQMPGVVFGQEGDPFVAFLRQSREIMDKKHQQELEAEKRYRDQLLELRQQKQEEFLRSANEFEKKRLEQFMEANTKALEVSDIRSGGISQFIALATGRDDPALTEAKKQVRELQNMRQDIQNLGVLVELTGVA